VHQRPDEFRGRRLSPAMASQRLLVLDFVRGYISRWGGSPSYGEIAAELKIERVTAWRAVRSLVDDGLLARRPGPRGLSLPDAEADALRQLRALGWVVNPEDLHVTKARLLPPAALDYPGPGQEGGTDDGTTGSRKEGA
jgi:hypothetical protein